MAVIKDASIEGPIEIDSVSAAAAGPGVELRSCDVLIRYTPSTLAHDPVNKIANPARRMTVADLLKVESLPGRPEKGFEGGTVIANGEFDTATQVFTAESITVEPAETVMLGALTRNDPGTPRLLSINGTPISMIVDPRMPAQSEAPDGSIVKPAYLNQYFFLMKIESAVLSASPGAPAEPSSVEGYYANDRFYAFLFQYGGTGEFLFNPATSPQISLERAQYRSDGATFRLEARGWVTTQHLIAGESPDVEIFRRDYPLVNNSETLRETLLDRVETEEVEPGIYRWRAEFRGNIGGEAFLRQPPFEIFVKYRNGNNATASQEPDIRLD